MREYMFGVMAVSGLSSKRKPKNAKKNINTLFYYNSSYDYTGKNLRTAI